MRGIQSLYSQHLYSYQTIEELLDLLAKIDTFQKLVFQNLRPSSNNEARIAALVPLVEESYSIYEFLTSMLFAMHQSPFFLFF